MSVLSTVRPVPSQFSWVTRYFFQQWKLAGALALFLLLTVGLQLGTPLILRAFLDAVSAQAAWDTVLRLALFYIVVAFVLRGVRAGENYLAELMSWKATNALRIDLVRHCLALDLSLRYMHPLEADFSGSKFQVACNLKL